MKGGSEGPFGSLLWYIAEQECPLIMRKLVVAAQARTMRSCYGTGLGSSGVIRSEGKTIG